MSGQGTISEKHESGADIPVFVQSESSFVNATRQVSDTSLTDETPFRPIELSDNW